MFTHTGERPHTCDKCGASFINSNLLKVHLYKHENFRPHRCQYCDMAFYRNYHLTRHTQVYHLNANPPKRKLPYRSENGTRKVPKDERDTLIMSLFLFLLISHLKNETKEKFLARTHPTLTKLLTPMGVRMMTTSRARRLENIL